MQTTVVVWLGLLLIATPGGAEEEETHYGLSVIHMWKRRKLTDTKVPNLKGNHGVHLQGYLVQAHPDESACDLSKTSPPPTLRPKPKDLFPLRPGRKTEEESWFLLAKRSDDRSGYCPIEDQILNAQNLGYKAIIIVIPGAYCVRTRSDLQRTIAESSISIYASFVGKEDGLVLEYSTFKECPGCHIEIRTLSDLANLVMEIFIITVLGIILLGFLAAIILLLDWIWKGCKDCKAWWLEWRRRRRWTRSSSLETSCGICLEALGPGRNRRTLRCGHAFHRRKCIDVWLRMGRRNCPICRARVEDAS